MQYLKIDFEQIGFSGLEFHMSDMNCKKSTP